MTSGAIWGGGERHILCLLQAFLNRPVDMSLVVFKEGMLSGEARKLGIRTQVIPKRFRGNPLTLLSLIRFIRSNRIDIVHTHLLSGNLYGRLAGRLAHAKAVVSTLHHADKTATGFRSPLVQSLVFETDNRMGALCDRIIATSEHLRQKLIRRGLNGGQLVTCHNGLSPEVGHVEEQRRIAARRRLGVRDEVKLVGTVGRLVRVKNMALFLRAARHVLDTGINARFVLIGDGPLRASLEGLARDLRLQGHVVFAGFQRDVLAFVSLFDIFVLCSDSENSSFSLLEAAVLGKAIVTTSVGGNPEIIRHGKNGWLCPPRNEETLADAICRLLCDQRIAESLGEHASQTLRNEFSLETMADKITGVYQELVSKDDQ